MPAAERALLLVAALVVAASGAAAQAPETRAKRIERQIEDARLRDKLLLQDRDALIRELQQLQGETGAAAAEIQATEARVAEIERRLVELEQRRMRSEAALDERRERMAELVLAIERLARVPREALLLRDQAPLDAARSGRLLAYAVPAIDAESKVLRAELGAVAATRAEVADERARLAAAHERLASERDRLDVMIDRRTRLAAALDAERAALAMRSTQLGRELGSVRELLERLASQKLANERAREAARAVASLPMGAARGQARPLPKPTGSSTCSATCSSACAPTTSRSRRTQADRGRHQRHADGARSAFELHGRQELPRHAGADARRVRRPRHRGHDGGRARQGRVADRRHARRPAGVMANDIITHIDDEQVQGLTLQRRSRRCAARQHQDQADHPRAAAQEPIEVTLTRDVIRIRAVRSRVEGELGYVRITQFNEQTTENLRKRHRRIKQQIRPTS
jgi:hypothetical protein